MGFIFQCFTIASVIFALYLGIFHFRDAVVYENGRFRICNLLSKTGVESWTFFLLPSVVVCDDLAYFAWFNVAFVYDRDTEEKEENDNEGGEPAVS